MRPDLFAAVAALSVPHRSRNPTGPPLAMLRAAGLENFYWFYFGREGVPEAEFEADVSSAIRRVLFYGSGDAPERQGEALMVAPGRGFLGGAPDPATLPPWLSEADVEVYAAAFRKSGFRGPFSWYRNIGRNWALLARSPRSTEQRSRRLRYSSPAPATLLSPFLARAAASRRAIQNGGCR